MPRFYLPVCWLALLSGYCCAEDKLNWGNWRGPNYDGSQHTSNPPIEWDAAKNVRWKAAIPGKGSGSPIVWDDRVYVVTAIKTDRPGVADRQNVPPAPARRSRGGRGGGFPGMNNTLPNTFYELAVLAYDRESGEEIWKTIVAEVVPHEGGHPTNTYASGSPITDGERLFVSFGSFGVYCLDTDGEVQWRADLGKMTTRNAFGEASSPALYQDTLVVPWDQDGFQDRNGNGERDADELLSSIIALDARTGETKWRTARPREVTTWATPLIVSHRGRTQVVVNGTVVRSYDLETGEQLWQCGGQVTNPIPSPIRMDDSVICMTGYRGNAIYSMALDSVGSIDDTDKVNWFRTDAAPYVASATLYKDQLYLTKERGNVMTSLDALTGDILIPQTRLSGIRDIYASAVAAADRIYFTGRDGTTTVIAHGQDYEELSINKLGEPVDASPAIAGNEIFIRAAEHLYCIADASQD